MTRAVVLAGGLGTRPRPSTAVLHEDHETAQDEFERRKAQLLPGAG